MSPRTRSSLTGRRAVVVNWRDPWHSLAGGSERYAWEFARALRAAGVRVEFLTARERGQRAAEVRDGIEIRRAGGPFTFYAHAALKLLRRRRRLDIVVDPECGIPTFSPLFVRRDTAVVLVLHHVHQEQFGTYFPAPLAWLGRTLERVVMPRVYRRRATVAVSDSTRSEMRTQFEWKEPVGILGNGAKSAADPDGLADAKDVDRLVVLGRLVPHKRVDLVLQTLHALHDERPGLHLDVCGTASAYYTSRFDDCLVVTADGCGDGHSATVSLGRDGEITRLAGSEEDHSPGFLYSERHLLPRLPRPPARGQDHRPGGLRRPRGLR